MIVESTPMAYDEGEKITVRISHYAPWQGGINCSRFVDGECVSRMANGQRWQDFIDVAIACPAELEFETKIIVEGREWICKDRGGAITYDGYAYWIDQLTANPEYSFGAVVEATIIRPEREE